MIVYGWKHSTWAWFLRHPESAEADEAPGGRSQYQTGEACGGRVDTKALTLGGYQWRTQKHKRQSKSLGKAEPKIQRVAVGSRSERS